MAEANFNHRYIEKALDTEAARVAGAKSGSRNIALNSAAFNLGRIPGCSESAILSRLTAAADQCGYIKEEGPHRVQQTIRRAIADGRKVPRDAANRHDRGRPIASDRNRRSVPASTATAAAPRPASLSPEIVILHDQEPSRAAGFSGRTMPDAEGKPHFGEWDSNGPPVNADELRRHVYRHDGQPGGIPVRIKIKRRDGSYLPWYRVADGHRLGWQARKPDQYVDVPYVGTVDPFDPDLAGDLVFWTEGERDTDTLAKINLPAFTFGGCGDGLPEGAASYVAGRHIVVLVDNDDAGREHGQKKAALCFPIAASVRVLELPDLPRHGDVTDFVEGGGAHDDLMRLAVEAPPWTPPVENSSPDVTAGRALVVRRASDIAPEPIEWVWPRRIARGKHTTIAGDPGVGKSQVTINIAAAVTTGGDWPCEEGHAPLGDVIFLSAEDGLADTIVPRLMAAGADRTRIHMIEATRGENGSNQSFNLQADIDLLEQEITRIGSVALIIIDPVSAYMGGADSHKNAEVRGVLTPISEMADRRRIAILSVTHLSKGGAGGSNKALYRFIGSIAFTAAPRAAFMVMQDPEDKSRCLFLHGKNNLAAAPQGLAYRLEQRLIAKNPDMIGSAVAWESEPVQITADQAMAAGNNHEPSAKDNAIEFLGDLLASGAMKRD